MEAVDARYHGQAEKVYPSLPASPTLTNPDMILPEYERARSPLAGTEARDHSPLMMWKHSYTAAHAAGPMTPLTPIIYGNGTMLSDIGEVTEVESTPGKHAPSRTRNPAVPSAQEPGLPALFRDEMSKKRSRQNLAMQRDRRCSIESTSTITAQSQGALYADFDDTLSVGDSVFQGDDEDSLASSADDPPALSSLLDLPSHDKMERMSTHSTVSIGQRAEEILANAKMRLTTMEGNLTRARSTLVDTSFGLSLGRTSSWWKGLLPAWGGDDGDGG
ncbi:hypothetical protein P8C59_004231 [Phyllachora maydis]|uniref:Uncharacterized protein n=1 Tax=Phyllachora maydis TaxID=1825666 RepID=A0AAD9ME60_9PEZI|nr:hypothetical protein P8C59_004231 [Phyllachora maydis]